MIKAKDELDGSKYADGTYLVRKWLTNNAE